MTEFNDINFPADFDDLSKYAPTLEKLRGKGEGFVVPDGYFSDGLDFSVANSQLSVSVGIESGFYVPENYFEELAERIISIVALSNADNKNNNPFQVPTGYFDSLTDEIVAIAQLSTLKNKEVFELPEEYFNELDENLNTTLALDNLKQDEGFVVPEGYFGNLSNSILSKIAIEELKVGSDSDIPSGYFDTLADRVADRIASEENSSKEETVERGRIIVFSEILKRYARPVSIAASVALVIGVSIWFFNRSNGGINTNSNIAKNEIAPKQNKQEVIIPQVKKDSIIVPPQIAVNEIDKNKKPVHKIPHRPLNPRPDVVVKVESHNVEKNDILNQAELLDENAITDYVNDQQIEIESNDDQLLNESMIEYLLNDNADPGLNN